MKVLLVADVRGVGKRGEVKDVAEGYARNFLLARKLAVPASGGALSGHQSHVSQITANAAARIEKVRGVAEKVEGKTVTFYLRTDKSGTTFGSVKAEEILRQVADEYGMSPDAVLEPNQPIKTTGDHAVVVSWKEGVKAKLTARVLPQS
jgi:large subunit ribosomal protein L9